MTKRILLTGFVLAALAPAARADISDSGALLIGSTAVVQGTMTVQGSAFSVGGSTFTISGGKAGVGTSDPAYRLDVAGDVRSTGTFYGSGTGLRNQLSLVAEAVLSASATTVSFTGLDLNADGHYVLDVSIPNGTGTGSHVQIFVNGDQSATNYRRTGVRSTTPTATPFQEDGSIACYMQANQECNGRAVVHLSPQTGYVFGLTHLSDKRDTTLESVAATWVYESTVTNVTQLDLKSTAAGNGLGVGSRISLYRGK